MPKFRILFDISYVDLLVDADSEAEAMEKVWRHYKDVRPFGGRPRMASTRVRQPWKWQLKVTRPTKQGA